MIDPNTVPLEEKLKTIRIARKLYENLMAQAIRPEHGETMRRLQNLDLETKRLREAAAKPKPAPRTGNDLGDAIARIGEVAPLPEPEPLPEEPPYTVNDAIRELRAADRGRR